MKIAKPFKQSIVWVLVLLLAVPLPVFAQDTTVSPKKFTQEQLDQMMAPIALYPDSLLAQILIGSTYPLELVMADRWVKENKDLKGDDLNDALDKQPWDASVKALVPFPDVLSMMSEKLEWTSMLGDAFLAQEDDVMDTIQRLRQKAYEAGNLKTTEQQKVIVEKEVIMVEPYNPLVVYVPVYDPWWVYGPWWWPAYPPYVFYPYHPGVVIAPGFIWFGVGFSVGAFWGHAWGHWDWRHRNVYVNVNRTININRRHIHKSHMRTATWRHDPTHRRGVAYRDPVSRTRFGHVNRGAVERRLDFRGFERDLHSRTDAVGRTSNIRPGSSRAVIGRSGAVSPSSRPKANVSRIPSQTAKRPSFDRSGHWNAFKGIGQGNEVRRQSTWGSSARSGISSRGSVTRGGHRSGGGFRGGRR
jgi:uncharacterized membrane protein YgcG